MIFKKFCDYGGYSYGWKCILCGEIIDGIPESQQQLKEGKYEIDDRRRHSLSLRIDQN
jgi:hypothetical protein